MELSSKDKKTCEKYGSWDEDGKVHCYECPLRVNDFVRHDFRCKANSHYNRHTREWEHD